EGLSTRDIGLKIFISVKTVETHRRNIMKKLNTNSIADLTRIALKKGLISL
ncbi:MAG: LuxR C-terminal-related transcriptional regulator, partial [Deltaproteobacteria bacterium]|nr:LuxR C-terminal-related transcriptional regulator [Deltaproteobacteria bacterium]